MREDLVSIIVPVYNVEKFVEKCVKSLMNQTHKNIEIILVDDGSPDHSSEIIDRIAAEDQRVHVIHQQNRGGSAARNAGLQCASGEYVMFVDGDDWVDSDYVSYFLTLVSESGSLIGMNKNNYSTGKIKTNEERYVVKAETAIEWIYSDEIFVAVWNKIYSRRLLVDNNISFDPTIWYGEGMLFNIQCLQYVDTVAIGEKSVYHQTFNPDSAMRKFNLKSNLCGIKSLDVQKSIWKKVTPAIEKAWEYHRYRFNRSISSGLLESEMVSEYPDVYKECIRNIRKGIMMPLTREKTLKAKVGWLIYFVSPSLMAKRSISLRKKLLRKTGGYNLTSSKILVPMYTPNTVHFVGVCA